MNCGVYKIENIKTGRLYIGSSNDLIERKTNHFSMLRNNKHSSIILQRAYNKANNKDIFQFSILEYSNNCDIDYLLERENYYLKLLVKTEEYINGTNKEFEKLSYNIKPLATKGFSGRHRQDSIEKMILNHPLRKSILIYKNNNFIKEVRSLKEAFIETGVSKTSILYRCKKKDYITKSGYIFCFKEDKEDLESKITNLKIEVYNKGKKYSKEEIINKFTQCTPIKVIYRNGEIQIFSSQIDTSRAIGIQPCVINRLVKSGKIHRDKGIKFEYHKDIV